MPKNENYIYHYCFQTYGSPISGVITVPFRVFDYDSYEDLKIKLGQTHHCPVKEILSLTFLGYERGDCIAESSPLADVWTDLQSGRGK